LNVDAIFDARSALLSKYVAEFNKMPAVSVKYGDDDFALGAWVITQRTNKKNNKLSAARIAKLEAIQGWVWTVRVVMKSWEESYEIFKECVFDYNEGSKGVLPKRDFEYKGKRKVGSWLHDQQKASTNGKLSDIQENAMSKIPGWDEWKKKSVARKKNVKKNYEDWIPICIQFMKDNNGNLPSSRQEYKGHKLGAWLNRQKVAYRAGKLQEDETKMALMNTIPGWKEFVKSVK